MGGLRQRTNVIWNFIEIKPGCGERLDCIAERRDTLSSIRRLIVLEREYHR